MFSSIRAAILAAVVLASVGTARAQSVAVILPPAGAAREAWQALEEARYKDAEAAFSQALASSPDDAALLVGSAIVARRLGHTPEARAALARALQLDPGMTPASQLLGTLLYESGDTDGAIRVYEAALFRKPDNQAMRERVEEWGREAALHSGFQRAQAGHFAVLFEGQAEELLAGEAVDILEDAYGRIGDYLQVYPAEAVTVILYTQQQFRDVTRTPGWSGGLFDGRIRLPVRGGLDDKAELKRVLTHEYVHALLFSIAVTGVPAWLNEGLATALEPGGLARAQQELSRARSPIPLDDLRRSFASLPADRVPLAYSESALVVQAMLDRAGAPRLVGLLKDLAAGTPFEQAFESWIQVSVGDFERDWVERARDAAGGGRHRDPH